MRSTPSVGAVAVLVIVLVLEVVGAGAYVVASAHADPADFCHGYAICR